MWAQCRGGRLAERTKESDAQGNQLFATKSSVRATETAFKRRAVLELDSETDFRESIGERCSYDI